MFETKKYQWLLTEISKSKSKLKILEISFIRLDIQEASFFTVSEDFLLSSSCKTQSIKETLKRFLLKRMSYTESIDTIKPVALLIFASHKKILYLNDIKELIKKDQKIHNLKYILLLQDLHHDPSTYYTLELYYDGEGLVSYLYRRDVYNSESMIKDNTYLNITLNLSKYLVGLIENLANKNLIRMKYDFVLDKNFCPIILYVSQIKLVHPKIIALNKGINVDGLENLTIIKHDYKGLSYTVVPTVVKEPDLDATPEETITKNQYTSLFMNFISRFLNPEQNSQKSRSPKQKSFDSISSFKDSPKKLSVFLSRSPKPSSTDILKSSKPSFAAKLPDLSLKSPKSQFGTSRFFFPSLQPNPLLSSLLKSEENRILESQSKRVNYTDENKDLYSELGLMKKKIFKRKNASKKMKRIKKVKSISRITSPYCDYVILK